MKQKIILAIVSLIMLTLCFQSHVFAETIVLKSGEEVRGIIVERNDERVTINSLGVSRVYSLDRIASIDGKKVSIKKSADNSKVSSFEKTIAYTPDRAKITHFKGTTVEHYDYDKQRGSAETNATKHKQNAIYTISPELRDSPGYSKVEKYTLGGQCYNNRKYGIKIWYPVGWEFIDEKRRSEIFKMASVFTALSAEQNLIVMLAGSRNNRLNPSVVVAFKQLPDSTKDLSLESVAILMRQMMSRGSLGTGLEVIDYPARVVINDKEFVRYSFRDINTFANGSQDMNIVYGFVKDTKLYTLGCSTAVEYFDEDKAVFEKIVGSVEVR